MSEDFEPEVNAEVVAADEAATQPAFVVDLRALLARRVEGKLRRIHKQWFCLDPQVQADLDAATEKLSEMVGAEILKHQAQTKRPAKYSVPTAISLAEVERDALLVKSRQVGAMCVLRNLTDTQVEAVKKEDGSFAKAKLILTEAFLRWETAEGEPIPAEQFGVEDLDALLQPEVLEQGEWLPLASTIFTESASATNRPTLPKS